MSTTNIESEDTQQYAIFSEPIQISEDVSCCLKVNAVIAKEGIYTFPAGPNGENRKCLWSRQELLKATRTARAAKITIRDHPPGKVVTSQEEIYGIVEKPFFDRDRIRAVLSYDKDITPSGFLEEVRAAAAKEGPPRDVSIGFYYTDDLTPGEWHGQPYDLVMRNIVIDHVATGVWKGRCSYPNCGIGISSVQAAAFTSVKVPVSQNGEKPDLSKKENEPVVEPQKPTTPEVPAQPNPPAASPPIPVKIQPKLNTAQLLSNSQSLLKFKHDRDVERLRSERRQPA